MIAPHFTTFDLKNRYHLMFQERWLNKPIYHGYNATITGANFSTAENIDQEVAGNIIAIKGKGYATIKSKVDEGNLILETEEFSGTTSAEFCISAFVPGEQEAFESMKTHILHGVEGIKDVARDVKGMIDRTNDSETDFLALIEDSSTMFDIPHRHLALHIIFLDHAMQGGEKFKIVAGDHFAQYIRGLNKILKSFAHSIKIDHPNTGDETKMTVSKMKRK